MPKSHALLSPSASSRWLVCTKSAKLEEQFPEDESAAATQGTIAHELAEAKVSRKLKLSNKRNPKNPLIDEEMQTCTDDYVSFVFDQYTQMAKETGDVLALVEEKLDLTELIPETFGTADMILVNDTLLHIIDFKYGKGVNVICDGNPQLSIYALGAISELSMIYQFQKVKLTIYQPRLNNIATWETSVEDLLNWSRSILIPKAKQALAGEGEYNPSLETCRFCKARYTCRARAKQVLNNIRGQSSNPPDTLSHDEIELLLPLLPPIEKWVKDITEYAYNQALSGETWHGYKLVHGRSLRKYSDENLIAQICANNGITDIFTKSLITVPKMQKLLGKKKFDELLGPYIIKPEGKLTLVPDSDKREAVSVDPKAEFEEVKEDNTHD